MDPRGTVGRIYKEGVIKEVSEKKIFLCFSHCKSMGANDPWGGGRKENHYTLLHTKYESSGPCGFREEDFYIFSP